MGRKALKTIFKIMTLNLKTVVLIILAVWSTSSFAQIKTVMYVMKNGKVVFQSSVSDVDNVTFNEVSSDNTLIVQKNDGSPVDKILLKNIQQLSFSGDNLSVKTSSGSKVYAFDDITKLLFGAGSPTGILNPTAQSDFDVVVHVTAAGDVTVESPVAIKSLTVYSVDGKMISVEKYNAAAVETLQATSLLQNVPAGIYFLRVETTRGTVVKKIVKPLSK